MIDALHISESGLKATQEWIGNISNNVANMQTQGFKKSTIHFEDMVSQGAMSSENNKNISNDDVIGMGSRIQSPVVDFSEGSFKATNRAMDVAIKGNGFFEVLLENGELAYTRIGNFRANAEGFLTTANSLVLSDQIQVPPDASSVSISEKGNVEVRFSDAANILDLGNIRLALVPNPDGLQAIGGGLYTVTESSGDAIVREPGTDGMGELTQGFLEMSNVELVEEMTNLVLAQRAYQLNARIIQTADQILETINNLRR